MHGWALVGLGEHAAATGPLRAAVRITSATADRAQLASAQLALGRALRRQGDNRPADEHLVSALTLATEHGLPRLRRAALRELCTLHADQADAGRALPYLQAYLSDELDRVDERRTRWVELFGRRKSLLETERAAGQLRRQAYEDPLTHLPNRRYAEARLDGLLSAGAAPALAVVDVDRFKEVNDAIGHPGGDSVLRIVGELLIAGVRDTDEVCRWAGDEYVILLPDTTAEQAERALERTRRKVATYDWAELGLDFPVTISVGIASAARGDDRRTLFAAADGVLYDAKRSGRDRVIRLSGVTQTRADASPLDSLFGPPPARARRHGRRRRGRRRAAVAVDVRAAVPRRRRPTASRRCSSSPARSTRRWASAAPPSRSLGPVPAASDGRATVPDRSVPSPSRPSPRSSGRPAAPPSRSSPWCARRGASTPTARPWCCARPRTRWSRWPASTTRTRRWTPPRWPPPSARCPSRWAACACCCSGGGDTPVAAEAAFVARVTGTEVVRVDDVGASRIRAHAHRRHAAGRRRLPGRRRRAGRLAGHDDRRDDRRPRGGGAHLDRPARPRSAASAR